MRQTKFWVAVVSKEHATRGANGGFIQVCHGKQAPLKRMQKGDRILVYSPRLSMQGTEKCQSFTAIGQATDDAVYPFQMSQDFIPFRRNIQFQECKEVSILPLIKELGFITNKPAWGFLFRFGFFEIPERDFNLIADKMLENEVVV
jgi:hypothetical protein